MKVTQILPAIFVSGKSKKGVINQDLLFVHGQKIEFTTISNQMVAGIFLHLELGMYEEEDDTIVIKVEEDIKRYPASEIAEIKPCY